MTEVPTNVVYLLSAVTELEQNMFASNVNVYKVEFEYFIKCFV